MSANSTYAGFWKNLRFGVLISLIFFLIGLLSINDYGLTWDTYHFWGGQITFDFLTGRRADLAGVLPYSPALEAIAFATRQALTSLNLLSPDAAFHLTILTVASLGLFIFFVFLNQALGEKVALVATLFLATYPRFFGHAHQNFKDIPSSVFFMATIASAYFAFSKRSWPWVLATGAVFGLALATKINAVFIPAIILLWRLIEVVKERPGGKALTQELKLWSRFLPALPVAAAVWFALSPNYWLDPVSTVQNTLSHFRSTWLGNPVLFLGKTYVAGINLPAHYATTYLVLVTPLPMLAAVMVGIASALKKLRQSPLYPLLLIWLAFPLAKYLYPGFVLYDDIRQFMEVVFPFAALAAIGLVTVAAWLRTNLETVPTRFFLPLLTAFVLLPSLVALVRYHPYQIAYFNGLIGGAAGAQGKFDLDFWATTVKEMTLWVNARAEPGESVNAVLGNHIVPYYLRDDLSIVYDSLEEPDYLLVINRQSFLAPEVKDFLTDKEPVYVIIRDGAVLGSIYKN